MNEATGQESLELQVANFGPIVQANVKLRPLTVFVGPSNTGKSYLAILIYALHRIFSGDAYLVSRRSHRELPSLLGLGGPRPRSLSEEVDSAVRHVASSLAYTSESSGQASIVLPQAAADSLSAVFKKLAVAPSREIARCFGVHELGPLIREGTANESSIVMRRRLGSRSDIAEQRVSLDRKRGLSDFSIAVPAGVPIPIDLDADGERGQRFRGLISSLKEDDQYAAIRFNLLVREFLQSLYEMMLPSLIRPLQMPAFYLPADRTGIMHAHSVVVNALIASAPSAGLHPATRTPMLSGVLADFLEQIIAIDPVGHSPRRLEQEIGKDIEKNILGGSVNIGRSTHINYPHFAYRPRGWKRDIGLANASSMVSELAPVVLYLRHVLTPNSVLIVEEPESHLHPAMQVELTRQLASCAKAGVRIIVTTHSEWLLEELGNIVRRSELPETERGDDIALRPDQVGVWLFKPKQRPRGSITKEIRLDDAGFYPSDFDEVAFALHNEWAAISSRIEADS